MSFRAHVCWSADRVPAVLDWDALQTSEADFLATHAPLRMIRQARATASDTARPYTEEELLNDFLAPNDFAFVPIIGKAGTGKSHMIRWLAANIPSTERRRVVILPKVGLNLRDMVGRILDGLEGAQFDEHRARLQKATGTLKEGYAREALLNELATTVGPSGVHPPGVATAEEEEFLVGGLPQLLHDPHFREHLLVKEGIIHRLVVHTIGRADIVERLESKRIFEIRDLPLQVRDILKASAAAREFYQAIVGDDGLQALVVKWLNAHLDGAIANVLKLGGEDLLKLMREIRETLAERDVELVFLIEDFAKLQGIDAQLLEAVLARRHQPGARPLCAMRTALACTTGYFIQDLPDTVHNRVDFVVCLEFGAVQAGSSVAPEDLQDFAARYLNAVRLRTEAVRAWYNDRRDGHQAPNHCVSCPHRASCHEAFGSRGDFGLYPFTPKSLDRMLGRVSKDGHFNPRAVIQHVLKPVLESAQSDLLSARFPSPALHIAFGGSRLPGMARKILNEPGDGHGDRREVLVDLWTDGSAAVNLHPTIHSAFQLPAIAGAPTATAATEPTVPLTPAFVPAQRSLRPAAGRVAPTVPLPVAPTLPSASASVPSALPKHQNVVESLESWLRGEKLTQKVAGELRDWIHEALRERIDWASEHLVRGPFVGSKDPLFPSRNIVFTNAHTGVVKGLIVLQLPLVPEQLQEFVLALQGLAHRRALGTWHFPNGGRYFRAYAQQLELWAESLLGKIRTATIAGVPFDPVPATAELLAVGARLAGRASGKSADAADIVNAMFQGLDTVDVSERDPSWQKLFGEFKGRRAALAEILTTWGGCTKGSSAAVQILDAGRFSHEIDTLRKEWVPSIPVPDLRADLAVIRELRATFDASLGEAIEAERVRYLAWVSDMEKALGGGDPTLALSALEKAAAKASDEGCVETGKAEKLYAAITAVRAIKNFAGEIEGTKKIRNATGRAEILSIVGQSRAAEMRAGSNLMETAEDFLFSASEKANRQIAELTQGGAAGLEETWAEIERSFAALDSAVAVLAKTSDAVEGNRS